MWLEITPTATLATVFGSILVALIGGFFVAYRLAGDTREAERQRRHDSDERCKERGMTRELAAAELKAAEARAAADRASLEKRAHEDRSALEQRALADRRALDERARQERATSDARMQAEDDRRRWWEILGWMNAELNARTMRRDDSTVLVELGEVNRTSAPGATKARVDSTQAPLLDGDIAPWLRATPHDTEHHSEQTHSAPVSDRPGDAPLSPEVLAAQLQVERALTARHASLPNGV
ncbi:MAG: hypothetical protein Q4G45_11800 [Actinomycetia bacterium]|nr:hypothetical protein [Actinomycetes bacterium]